MAIREKEDKELTLNLSPMIDVTFLILIYFIVSMQMEPSLDNIIKLPPVLRASKQEDALLQIYILPAKVRKDGTVLPDSTGLIAFSDKAKTPALCQNPQCRQPIKDKNDAYIPNSLQHADGTPIPDLQKAMAAAFSEDAPPPVFHCVNCGSEVGPYVKLRDIPHFLREKKKEVLALMARSRNLARSKRSPQLPPLDEKEREALEDSIALMIKADEHTYYGRILQVVNMAKDTTAGIKNFAFVTDPTTSQEAVDMLEKKRKDQ